MTTLVYPVKPGEDNEELRYSLRSLVNFPHERVVIVGHKPSWVQGVGHIPGNRRADKWWNVFDNLLIAARSLDRFTVMNDDFFVMRPVDGAPSWHRGLLAEHISGCRGNGAWRRSLTATLQWLQARGVPVPLSYEIHAPVEMDGPKLAAVLEPVASMSTLPQWRTLYGNTYQIASTQQPDPKLRKVSTPWDPTWPFVSTDDATFGPHPAGQQIRALFPDPSPYEVAHARIAS